MLVTLLDTFEILWSGQISQINEFSHKPEFHIRTLVFCHSVEWLVLLPGEFWTECYAFCTWVLFLDLFGNVLGVQKHPTRILIVRNTRESILSLFRMRIWKSCENKFGLSTFYPGMKYRLFMLLLQPPYVSTSAVKIWGKNIRPILRCNCYKLCYENQLKSCARNTFGHSTFYLSVKYRLFMLLLQPPCVSTSAVKIWAKNIRPILRCNCYKIVLWSWHIILTEKHDLDLKVWLRSVSAPDPTTMTYYFIALPT